MKSSFLPALGLFLLAANGSAWAQTPFPFPTQPPSRVAVEPQPSTTYDQNTARIHWRRGNGTYFIVLIRYINEYTGNPVPAMVEPDERPYSTTGNPLMNAASLVPNNPYYPTFPRSQTYLLRQGTYGSPADTIAQVNNAAIGHKYEVKVYEYNTDPRGNFYVSAAPVPFIQPRTLPHITSIRRNAQGEPVIEWTTIGEYYSSYYLIQYAADSTQLSSAPGSSFQVAPQQFQGVNNYSLSVPIAFTGPMFFRVVLVNGYRPELNETSSSQTQLGNPAPLPVTLTRFVAERNGRAVQLRWHTASELNNEAFVVQRAADGRVWQNVGQLPGHGTISQGTDYAFADEYAAAGYYRLAQRDTDQKYTYSPVRFVTAAPGEEFAAFPNPSAGTVEVRGGDAFQPLLLLDGLGQQVRQSAGPLLSTQGLMPGVYALRQGSQVTRLVVR